MKHFKASMFSIFHDHWPNLKLKTQKIVLIKKIFGNLAKWTNLVNDIFESELQASPTIWLKFLLQHPEQPEIEKEVKRLLRMDNEAIDVKWEVVYEEENANQDSSNPQIIMQGESSKADPTNSLGLGKY